MKKYLSEIIDLTGDSQLNPSWTGHTRKVNTITSISIHHDAQVRPHDYDSEERYRNEAAYQNNISIPGSKGIQYHYKIDNVGQIFKLRPHETWLWTVGSDENTTTLAICLDGYFHAPLNQLPTREQYEALGQLLVDLCEDHPEFPATYPNVRPHRDFSPTACPGDLLAPWVAAIESKEDVLHIPNSAVYDWPEYQTIKPVDAVQPAPAPVPEPDTTPEPTTPPAPPEEPIEPLPPITDEDLADHLDLKWDYKVVDKNGKQLGVYSIIANAYNTWLVDSKAVGKIIDKNGNDVTDTIIAKFKVDTDSGKEPVAEGTKETARTGILAVASFIISWGITALTGLPQSELTVILLIVLKGLDKYIHTNPNINLKGILPF